MTQQTIRTTDKGSTVQLWMGQLHWATYDLDGARIAQGSDRSTAPTDDELVTLDAIAPRIVDALLATDKVAPVARPVARPATCRICGDRWCYGDCEAIGR